MIMLFVIIIIIIIIICDFFYKDLHGGGKRHLQEAATNNNFLIVASVLSNPFLDDEQYKITLKNEFNLLTTENGMKFSTIHPQRDTYDFHNPDLMVDFAEDK